VEHLLQRLKQIYFASCYIAWFVNIGLLLIASIEDLPELQILSLVNMILLSFVLLSGTNENPT
jgi:hypothetical protein